MRENQRTPAVPLVLLAVSLGSGCMSADDSSGVVRGEWTSETAVLGDTVIVRTISGSVWGDTMDLVRELEIGALDGPPELVFGRPTGLDVSLAGRIAVVDALAREVRIFSPTGDHEATFGGQGDGPGEFRSPDQVRIVPDGQMVVRDPVVGRFSVFAPDGTYVSSWVRGTGYSTNAPFFLRRGAAVLNPSLPEALVSYDLDGTIQDTVAVPTRGYSAPTLTVASGDGWASYSIPFVPAERWTMDPEGRVVFGVSDRYVIERWEETGGVLRIERQVSLEAVPDRETDQARESITRTIQQTNDPTWRWSGPDVPRVKPAFQALLAGIDGSIWVIRAGASVEVENPQWDSSRPAVGFPTSWQSSIIADVFDGDGRYLGPVRAPASMSWTFPHAIVSQDQVWGVTTHELGYPQVVRYRVERLN